MNRLIEITFKNRGYSEDFLRDIELADHDTLKDIDKLAVRLKEIHDDNTPITVFPDFDMDGIAAGTLGFAGLAELGFNVNLFIPNPEEGYGVSVNSVKALMTSHPSTKVIITCDTGITAAEAADYCASIGVEFIVTDHHMQSNVINASIIVDPLRADETYSHPSICGAHVLYQVLQYYADLYGTSFARDQIARLRVFAGIGTVSDTMPVLYENRRLVRDAIDICRLVYGDGTAAAVNNVTGSAIYRKAFWGLYDFFKVCEDVGIIRSYEDINEDFFGFYLAPIFNSAKRMNGDMNKTFGVFFANDSQRYAEYLYELNVARKELVARELKAILAADQPYAPYVYFTTANPGILGLLATKLENMSGEPTFVAIDEGESASGSRYHGSGRSPEWYPCIDRLLHNETISIAGHNFAFGWGCGNKTQLERFVRFLKQDTKLAFEETDIVEIVPDFVITPDWTGDTGIDIALFDDYLHEIELYKPFGKGFPSPDVQLMFNNSDVIEWKQIGSAKEHLKIVFPNGFECLCWNQGYLVNQPASFDRHSVRGKLSRSSFRGVESINFVGTLEQQG